MVAFLAFLASPLGKLAGWALIGLVALAVVFGVKAEWDHGQAAIKQVASIRSTSAVQVKAVAKVDHAAAKTDTAAQVKIVTRTRTLLKKVNVYVPVSDPCVPWGVVRVHDASVLGVDPSSLQLPAGATDATCSDVSPSAFVATVVTNYGAAEQNAQQLNDLEANLRARAAATQAASPAPTTAPS